MYSSEHNFKCSHCDGGYVYVGNKPAGQKCSFCDGSGILSKNSPEYMFLSVRKNVEKVRKSKKLETLKKINSQYGSDLGI